MIATDSLYSSYLKRFCGIVIISLLPLISLNAQERCGTVEYNKTISSQNDPQNREKQFENWLSQKIIQKKTQVFSSQQKQAGAVMEIPVVIHIIHNNEPIGTGTNITDEQIQSQIDVLNEDFRRQNADKSNTPANFIDVAADLEIEFVMAKRDPEGLATTAILRTAGTQSSWSMSDNSALKSLSYWPAEDYLNIWVTAISGNLLGYAQFPVSDQLDGLEDGSFNALTDGLVIDYEVFGSIDIYPAANLKSSFNKGRTATHEIGHFLGLRHTWGDQNCGTDYCADTPTQASSTNGCPSHPQSNSCGAGTSDEMFENFMDYTNDQCMNLFTLDQGDRIKTVLENSPRRASLTTSIALLDPVIYDNDLGIFSIASPGLKTCNAQIIPAIVIKNYGNNNLTSAEIQLSVNGTIQENLNVSLEEFSQLASTTISFFEVTLVEGNNILEFEIITVNGVTDQGTDNNIAQHTVNLPTIVSANLMEDFQNGIENMTLNNIDGTKTWQVANAPDGTLGNKALFINYFNYDNEGTEDWLLSPIMNFSDLPVTRLIFDYAHAQYPGSNDRLKVMYSEDCGQSFAVLFDKSGKDLTTTGTSGSSEFIPSSEEDWESESIDLSDQIGKSAIQIAFVGVNDFGNNVYLDNISIITTDETSIKLRQIDTPSIVTGSTTQPLNITVKNTGGPIINELDISYSVDNQSTTQLTATDLNIASGSSAQIALGDITSDEGIHNVSVTIANPNGSDDYDDADNVLSVAYTIDLSTDVIPLYESFEAGHSWVTATRSSVAWDSISIGEDIAMYVNSFQNFDTGGKAWLVSPILDFSEAITASMFFHLSYALSSNGNSEVLKVLLSEDGGLDNYPHELLSITSHDLSTHNQIQNNWAPEIDNLSDWDSLYVNLSEFTGADNIRIAFQLTNNNGNNFYLDNIEFFTSDNPAPVNIGTKEVSHFPNPIIVSTAPHLNLIFNLQERQKADIRIFDLAGNQVFEQTEPYTLNQTYTYDMTGLPSGMLILSVIGETFRYNKRIIIIR